MHTKYLLEWYVTDDVPCLAIKVTYTSRMGREMGDEKKVLNICLVTGMSTLYSCAKCPLCILRHIVGGCFELIH